MKEEKRDKFPIDALTRFYRIVDISGGAVKLLEKEMTKNINWIQYSVKIWSKLLLHGKSMCLLSADTMFETKRNQYEANEFYNLAGIFSSVRIQMDCYSTLFHLHFDGTDMELRRLRFDLWRYDSLLSLNKTRKNDERISKQIIAVKNAIHDNEYFISMEDVKKKLIINEKIGIANWKFNPLKLDQKGNANFSWSDMFLKTGIRQPFFEKIHNYLSLHVHSGYISVDMMATLDKIESYKHKNYAILLATCVQCFALDDFAERFEKIRKYIQKLSKLEKEMILSVLSAGREDSRINAEKYA